MARLVAQAARNAADDLDHSGHRLWRKAGWTATVPAGDRIVLTGPGGKTVTHLIPGVHLPTSLHLPIHPDQASTDEHPAGPGVHLYAPHGAARDVFTADQDEVLLSGPAGTGKSRAALELLGLLALAWPGMRGLIIRKTLTSLGSTALVTWREKVIPEALEAGLVHFYGGSQQEAAAYRYTNGSAINLGGMDKSTRVMSSDYDCVVGGTVVESPSPIERCYSRPYSGQLVTITTAAGHELTGTPNHPVLTDQGWVALGRLREGDHVVSRIRREPLSARADPHIADQPAPIREVARALAFSARSSGRAERVETVPMDFHGDGGHSYVDVVTTTRLFQDWDRPSLDQPISDLYRTRRDLEQAALMSNRTFAQLIGGLDAADGLSSSSVPPELAHPLTVGLRTTPDLGGALTTLGEIALPLGVNPHPRLSLGKGVRGSAPGNAPGGHLPLEPGHADADRKSDDRQPTLAGEVALDRIVKISVADAGRGGHVYNLQTVESWYYANEIVSHNCVFVQEAIELTTDNWEALTTRLRNARTPVQQLLADTNPDKPTHWLNVRCDRGDTRMLHCRHSDNPTLVDPATGRPTVAGAAYLAKLSRLTGVRKARLERGQWVAAEGIIYDGYDPAIHLVDRFEIPADWTRWIVVDFGFTNPFSAQWWAEDGEGRLWMYREIYHTRRLVEDHARTMLAQMRDGDGVWLEPRPTAVICDHDAEDRATLERHLGMSTQAAHKTVKDGIQAMQARLRPAGDGRPRLYILRDSLVERDPELEEAKKPTCLVEELPGYVWDPGAAQAGQEKATKETPLKVDDHGCDCARYLCAERDLGARPRVRWM